jgi:LacI family transcriptional regulator
MAKQTASKLRGGAATIRDVADQAGVSMSTVSHVINGTRYVSDEKRKRVLDAMHGLNYRPNSLARSLRRQRSFTIGVVVPDSRNPFFADIARGIEDAGFDLGYTVTICSTDERPDKEEMYVNSLIDRQVDGVAIVVARGHTGGVRLLVKHGVPMVAVDRDVPDEQVDSVLIDNYAGGYAVGQHLASLGYRACALAMGPDANIPIAERMRGYRDALAACGVPLREDLIAHSSLDLAGGYQAIRQLLATEPGLEAVFTTNDLTAIGAMRGALELGYSVPARLAVVGYDNIDLAAYTTPALTTVAQPRYEIGRHAGRMLLRRIADPAAEVELVRLMPELLVRESSRR